MARSSQSARNGDGAPQDALSALPRAPVPKPITITSLASDYLRTLLFDGLLRPGDRISLDGVAEALSASRQPVREAVLGLVDDGLVVTSHRSGTFVDAFDADVIRDHHELHGLLEARAVERVTLEANEEVVRRLRDLARQAKHGEEDKPALEAALAFHRVIGGAGASPRLRALLRSMTRFVPPSYFADRVEGSVTLLRDMPERVLTEVERGDPKKAGEAVQQWWRDAGELLVAHLERTGVL